VESQVSKSTRPGAPGTLSWEMQAKIRAGPPPCASRRAVLSPLKLGLGTRPRDLRESTEEHKANVSESGAVVSK